jgi:Zn-dependent protease
MRPTDSGPDTIPCPGCARNLPTALLACPACHTLVHQTELKSLAQAAAEATTNGKPETALEHWQRALPLLPANSKQHAAITNNLAALEQQLAQQQRESHGSHHADWKKRATGLGVVGLLIWKFKFIVIFVFTKLKFLALGLSKMTTFFTMFLTFGLYWTVWGWRFALGIVLSIYVHEMGHVWALRHYGIRAGAPMFIPGLGALIRIKQHIDDPHEDAIVGLAGPIWGVAAAIFCYAVYLMGGGQMWGAIAHLGAFINLFNLLPFWQLDGGRAFHGMSRTDRWLAVAVIATVWFLTKEGLLVLIGLVAIWNATRPVTQKRSDPVVLVQYAILLIITGYMCLIKVDVG